MVGIKPIHIQLKKGDIAERVLIAGDPERIVNVSHLLTKPKLINRYRYTVYTGEYKGKRVSLSSHGIGAPSIAIAVEELHALGGRSFIRLGTCGGLLTSQKRGDLIIPDSALSFGGGAIKEYGFKPKSVFSPNKALTDSIIDNVRRSGKRYTTGTVFSSEALYEERRSIQKIKKKLVGVEMECATLFMLGKLREFKAASLLVVVDLLSKPVEESTFLAVEEMHRLSKEAAVTALDALVESR